ncbi:MAG: hypothetical protein RLZZ366_2296, partial [Pseudomonadota bacterium]
LLRIFRAAIAPQANPKALLTRLKTALFTPFSLTNYTKPPPRRPDKTTPSPQFALELS